MAPCVMWIDEIEKGISGGNDDGTSKRILGALLTWLAENRKNVYIVATANNIDDLPPELIRKGRLDEIFFVDLPRQDVRQQIFSIHLDKREINRPDIDLGRLAVESDGFSGAEIEQAVVSAVYSNYGSGEPLTTESLLDEIRTTRPLSVVMDAQIQKLKKWAESRTVPVD
jgi:SpoVK/Ycf46/Vps4 family AAA+-type ATPase